MEYKNYIYNSSVILDSEWSCTFNCPWCNFAVKERNETNKLSIEELKKRIDFASENLSEWYSLILHPWNVLLEYDIEEIEYILEYASSKQDIIQWEVEKIDEKILIVLDGEKIRELIKTKKLFLNLWYVEWKIDLLNRIYDEICKIWIENLREVLIKEDLYEEIKKLNEQERFDKLSELVEDWILPWAKDSIALSICTTKWHKRRNEIIWFLDKVGFEITEETISNIKKYEKQSWDMQFHSTSSWVLIVFHHVLNRKIDEYWNNIWKTGRKQWEEFCLLTNHDFEWSVSWNKDWNILPHVNPCINKLTFWNLDSSQEELNENFKNFRDRIRSILIKNKYKKWFNQSELCNWCLSWDNYDISKVDIAKYAFRETIYEYKKFLLKIFNYTKNTRD